MPIKFIELFSALIINTKCLLCARHISTEWGVLGQKPLPAYILVEETDDKQANILIRVVMGGVRKVTGCCERVRGGG